MAGKNFVDSQFRVARINSQSLLQCCKKRDDFGSGQLKASLLSAEDVGSLAGLGPVFFPPVWPIRTRLGPYNCVSSEKQECTRTRVVQKLRQIITKTTTNKKQKTTTTKNDPQIPQPDLRFATKQNSEATKNGAGPNKTKKAFRFALDTVTLATVSSSKTCKLIIHCGSA